MVDKVSKDNMEAEEIIPFDYLIVVARRKTLIAACTLAAAFITAIVTFILPPVYRAETTVLPPGRNSSSLAVQMLGQMSGFPGIGAALGIGGGTGDVYAGMLRSRTVADAIVDRFDLMRLYGADTRQEARERLMEEAVDVKTDSKSGILTVSVEDSDPKRAADMANAIVEELRKLSLGLAVSEANDRRLFFEERLRQSKEALAKAEEDMRAFQERTGALQIDSQAKAVIEGMAELKAQIAAKEVEAGVIGTYATPNNPDLKRAEAEVRALKAELYKLETKGAVGHDPLMPTGNMPSVGTEYLRRLRELKFNEALHELLLKQYEAARLDEAGNAQSVQVIDRALPPDKKYKPKIFVNLAIATASGFLFSVALAFFLDYMNNFGNSPENRRRVEALKEHIRLRRP